MGLAEWGSRATGRPRSLDLAPLLGENLLVCVLCAHVFPCCQRTRAGRDSKAHGAAVRDV